MSVCNFCDVEIPCGNIECAIREHAEATREVAAALQKLGLSDAASPLGAIEMLSMEVKNGAESIASALEKK